MIEGGYYIKARCVQESEIAHCPPHFREIWDWLLLKANHKERKLSGKTLQRGQLLTSYKGISDGLSWKVGYRLERYKKWEIEKAMKWLTKTLMVATTKTTRGMVVTVLNYDKYQNQKNYESDNGSDNKATVKRQDKQECKELKKEKKELEYPSWLNLELWKEFKKHRTKIRAGLSEYAEKINLKKLSGLVDEGHDPDDIINQTIACGWKGFFAPKEEDGWKANFLK
jgi:hypothetical protein